jgi:hypothetical protein
MIALLGVFALLAALLLRAFVRALTPHPRLMTPGALGPTPMQQLFTNDEIGLLLKYRIQWTSVEQAKRVLAALQRQGG